MVLIHHFNYNAVLIDSPFYFNAVEKLGKLGVVLFFTLSGFLITYLLLIEKKNYGIINIKNFYIRRVLRIWPLYFLIVLSSLFILNDVMYFQIPGISSAAINEDFIIKIFLFVLILPNIAYAFGLNLPYADQVWSIGVEEQFYLFWPWFIKKAANPKKRLLLFIFYYELTKVFLLILKSIWTNQVTQKLYFLFQVSNFSTMAFGGLAAVLLFEGNRQIKKLYRIEVQCFIILVSLVLLLFGVQFGFFNYEIYSILFAITMLILVNEASIISLESRVLIFFGKISYGIYMYHYLAMRIVDLISLRIFFFRSNILFKYFLMFVITILLSSLSYFLFEKLFLRKKEKFQHF